MSYRADKQVIDTHTHTDRYTDRGDDNTRRTKLASGKKANDIIIWWICTPFELSMLDLCWNSIGSCWLYFQAMRSKVQYKQWWYQDFHDLDQDLIGCTTRSKCGLFGDLLLVNIKYIFTQNILLEAKKNFSNKKSLFKNFYGYNIWPHTGMYKWMKQGKSVGCDSCHLPNNLIQTGFKSSMFQPVWPWNLMDDLEKQ